MCQAAQSSACVPLSSLDMSACNLSVYGITFDLVAESFKKLLGDTTPTVIFQKDPWTDLGTIWEYKRVSSKLYGYTSHSRVLPYLPS